MRVYWALFQSELRQHLQYRISALSGALTNIAFGFFRLFLITAFYAASEGQQPMTLPEIRSGAVAYRLTRPVSLYSYYYARVLGQRTTALLTRSLIQVVILMALLPPLGLARYGMGLPVVPLLPLLALSVVAAIFLSAAIQTLVYMSSFWTVSTRGSASLSYAVNSVFSGLLVPLAFFPPGLARLAAILPFRGVYDTPARLYTGAIGGVEALLSLGHQALWILLLVALGSHLARRGVARLEVAGG